MFIFSQILGIISIIITLFAYFCKNKRIFLFFQIFSSIFYSLSLIVLKAYTGGLLNAISIFRCLIFFIVLNKKINIRLFCLILFSTIYITLTIFTYRTFIDLLPLITSLMFTFSYFIKDIQLTRKLCIIPNILLFIYNINFLAYTNAILDVLEIIIAIVTIIKFKNAKKSSKVI